MKNNLHALLFQTRTPVHSEDEAGKERRGAERDCLRSELRLFLLSAVMLPGVTVLLMGTGAASWWLLAACLVPGVVLMGIGALLKRMAGAPTLEEALLAALGKPGLWIWRIYMTLLFFWQSVNALTAMVCLFTEGVETSTSPFMLAIITTAAVLCCCIPTGLPRCAWLMRFPLGLLALALVLDLSSLGRLDHFLPLIGAGDTVNQHLLVRMCGIGWPMLLFLSMPPREIRRCDGGPFPTLAVILVLMLALCAALPTELATLGRSLADAMLLPTVFLAPLNRTMALMLWTMALMLTQAIALRRGAETLKSLFPIKRSTLPLLALAVATVGVQAFPAVSLRQLGGMIRPWLLAPAAVLLVLALPGAARAGRRRSKQA